MKNGNLLGEFGDRGYGPTDYGDLEFRTLQSHDKTLTVFDAFKNQLEFIDVVERDGSLQFVKSNSIQLPVESLYINDMILLNDSTIIGQSNSDLWRGQLFKFNLIDRSLTEFSFYEDDSLIFSDNLNRIAKYELYFQKIVKHPKIEKFAVLNNKFDRISIYDEAANLLHQFNYSPEEYLQDLTNNNNLTLDNAYNFALNTYSTSEYIFSISTGRTNSEMKNLSDEQFLNLNTELRIFDWKGKLKSLVSLDKPIFLFCVDEDSGVLYAISPFEDNKIYTYDLNYILIQ